MEQTKQTKQSPRSPIRLWPLPIGTISFLVGAALAGVSFHLSAFAVPVLIAGIVIFAFGTIMLIIGELRLFRPMYGGKYACPRCDYEPSLWEVKHERPYPCPTCGRTMYGE